ERDALLAQRGVVAPDPRERLRAALRAERAGDLLLDLEHAQVLLCLVVVEGDGEVVEESQHCLWPHPEAFEQVAWRGLLATALLTAWWPLGERIGGQPLGHEFVVADDESVALGLAQLLLSPSAGLLDRSVHLQPERLELLGPGL